MLTGFFNAFGNVSIIFAIKFARDAGSSPAAINCLLMINVLIALSAGLIIFGEKHTIVQYIGGAIIIGAVILITFERSFSVPGKYTKQQDVLHFTAIVFTFITCVSWSSMIITTKYCCFHYKVNIIEYSGLAMGLSGFMGSLTGIPILHYGTPMNFVYKDQIIRNIIFAIFAGLFTTFGQFSYFAAVNLGSVEVAQLFVNMKPIVQLIEEAIIFGIFPTFLAFIGILIAIGGATLVIFGKPKEDNGHRKVDDD